MNKRDCQLRFYDQSVLRKYQESPKLYKVEEEAVAPGGSIFNRTDDDAWDEVMFGYRRLKNRDICIVITESAFGKLPESEASYWSEHSLLKFAENDPEFDSWAGTHLEGKW